MSWPNKYIRALFLTGLLAGATILLLAARTPVTGLEAVRERGALVIAVSEGPTSYHQSAFGPAGFEYELAEGFARELGVRLDALVVGSDQAALDAVASGQADIAVGLALSPQLERQGYALSMPVQSISQLVICPTHPKAARKAPPPLAETVAANTLLITRGSHHARQLAALHDTLPALTWQETDSNDAGGLLAQTLEEPSACAVVDANVWAFHRHVYAGLTPVGELPKATFFGWVQSNAGESSLRSAANTYLARVQSADGIVKLRDRHFAHIQSLTGMDSRNFYRAIQVRLPRYAAAFRREAERNNVDWRLLAAVAYQESHWDPNAMSPTGVQGLMQLTLDTAAHLGIVDRTDPMASIRGGARYLRQLIDSLPAEIPEADRTWMALAAYNAGLAHVLDARALTRKRGGNPDNWQDVRASLALLKDPKWYSQTRYGYARGATQAILYVRHVRRYYDLMVLAGNNGQGDKTMAMGYGRQQSGPTR